MQDEQQVAATTGTLSPSNIADSVEQPAPPASPSRPRRSSFLSAVPTSLNFWVPLLTAMVSLVISIWGIVVAGQEPEVVLIMPNRVYMSELDPGGSIYHPAAIYLQPNFVSAGNNNRTELIRHMTLKVEQPNGEPPPDLRVGRAG